MSDHGFSSDLLRENAKKVIIEDDRFLKMGDDDAPAGINGRTLDMEMNCHLPGLTGAQWRQVRHFMAVNMPGLLDRTPSPDSNLRRYREVKQETKAQNQVRPALQQTI